MGFRALLGFAPFVAFALMEKLIGIEVGLAAGLTISLALLAWEVAGHRGFNILELGSALIFALLTAIAVHRYPTWSVWEVRLYVDGGLALVVFLSVLIRRPFTLQYGRRAVSPDARGGRDVLRHSIISSVWGSAFAGLGVVDFIMTCDPGAPDRRGIILTLALLAAAARFTQWYVKRIRNVI